MATDIKWTPVGCSALLAGTGAELADTMPDYPCDLLDRAGELNLDSGAVFFAWEIARLAGEKVDSEKKRALILLILAIQAMSVEGSTRLPLSEGGHFDRILKDLQVDDHEKDLIKKLLKEAGEVSSNPGSGGLANIFGKKGDYRPLIFDHGYLYIQKLHVLEERVGKNLSDRLMFVEQSDIMKLNAGPDAGAQGDAGFEEALQEVFNTPPTTGNVKAGLDEQQQLAVRTALNGRITVISGRPGSGKTSIVASILRVLARVGNPPLQSIALTAPTGKAADRLRQSVTGHLAAIESSGEPDRLLLDSCPPSTTLHRLLGYSPGRDRFWHNEQNPLPEKLIIVDESSMIDLVMMDHLLRAMLPEARLILLGDADQLPSIEAGAVLRDLCRSKEAAKEKKRVIALEKSYRAREEDSAGKQILEVAKAINEGRPPVEGGDISALATRYAASELAFAGVEHLVPGGENQKADFLDIWYKLLIKGLPGLKERLARPFSSGPAGFDEESSAELKEVMAHFEKFRILCATRMGAGDTGSGDINSWLYSRWLEYLKEEGLVTRNPQFLLGEPVMMTRNDHSLRLYNGDSGLVLKVVLESAASRRSVETVAVFPRGGSFVAYPLEALRGYLEPAWATTVHKAQGSEYENVVIMLPAVYVRPLTRELLYTAVTRAKKSVVIVGSQEMLQQGISHSLERASGLADML